MSRNVGGGVVLSRREGADEKAERVRALDGYRGMMRGAGESAGARALARKPEKKLRWREGAGNDAEDLWGGARARAIMLSELVAL